MNEQGILVAISAGTLIFLLFSGFIIAYVMIYWKKKVLHAREVDSMKSLFNEELLKSKLAIKEETLTTISQEIHDNVGQTLSLAKLQLNILEHHVPNAAVLPELKETLGRAMTDLRNLAKNLNTENIQLASLPESIGRQVQQIARAGIADISLTVDGAEQPINDHKKLILFRIMQESLQNIIKHASATCIRISFGYRPTGLDITISDNGIGFDTGSMEANGGLGLRNIMQRAALIGGTARISSTPHHGTNILITTPYE